MCTYFTLPVAVQIHAHKTYFILGRCSVVSNVDLVSVGWVSRGVDLEFTVEPPVGVMGPIQTSVMPLDYTKDITTVIPPHPSSHL